MRDDFVKTIDEQNKNSRQNRESQQKHDEVRRDLDELKQTVLFSIESNKESSKDVEVTNLPKDYARSSDIRDLAARLERSTTENVQTQSFSQKAVVRALEKVSGQLAELGEKDTVSAIVDALGVLGDRSQNATQISNLDELGEFFFSLERKIEDALNVEFNPTIDVEAPNVTVEQREIDFSELTNDIKNVTISVTTLAERMESQMLESNRTQEKMLEALMGIWARPQVVGSGGGLGTGTATTAPEESVYDTATYGSGTYS